MSSPEEQEKLVNDPEQGKKENKVEGQNPEGQPATSNVVDPNNKGASKQGTNPPEEKKEEEGSLLSGVSLDSFSKFIIACLFEFVGTFLFIVAILLGSSPEATIISFWIIITVISPFSGGHVNPAVTFGCYIYDMKLCAGIPKLIMYWLAQIAGGALALWFATGVKEKVEIIIFKQPVEYPQFMAEFFYTGTFILIILYCCSKITRVSDNRALNCVIIASWLYYAATSAGKRSVGALNPAILSVFSFYNAHVKENWYQTHKSDVWRITAAHFGGAMFFALFFFALEGMFPDPPKPEEEKKDDKKEIKENKDDKLNVK